MEGEGGTRGVGRRSNRRKDTTLFLDFVFRIVIKVIVLLEIVRIISQDEFHTVDVRRRDVKSETMDGWNKVVEVTKRFFPLAMVLNDKINEKI